MKLVRRVLQFILAISLSFVTLLTVVFLSITGTPEPVGTGVNDVTQINPIAVDKIARPISTDEIVQLVRNAAGPVSIGGARHSMGGQIGTEGSLHLDMRDFDSVTYYNKETKEITVQSGITWRKIQEQIDPDDLSVRIMQSYADFTVGGSLSVNVHGRYIGEGPIIHSVKSLSIVLADGRLVTVSREQEPEIFFGAIGGYGGLGVIVEAAFWLTDNCKVKQQSELVTLDQYPDYFLNIDFFTGEKVNKKQTVLFKSPGSDSILEKFKTYNPHVSEKSVLFALGEVNAARENKSVMPEMLMDISWKQVEAAIEGEKERARYLGSLARCSEVHTAKQR